MIKFAIQLALFLTFLIFYWMQGAPVQPTAAIALTPLLLLLMAGLGLGAGIIVSALTTRYRDLQQLVAFGVQLMMYATPVVYPLSMIGGGSFRWLILANPMTPIVETFRYAYLGSGTFDGIYLCYSAGFALAVLFIGVVLFNHVERTFMDTVWGGESGKRKVEGEKWKAESGKWKAEKRMFGSQKLGDGR